MAVIGAASSHTAFVVMVCCKNFPLLSSLPHSHRERVNRFFGMIWAGCVNRGLNQCQWQCRIVQNWQDKNVQLTTFRREPEGSGNASDGGLFHDTRFVSPRAEYQPDIQKDWISSKHCTKIPCHHPLDTEKEARETHETQSIQRIHSATDHRIPWNSLKGSPRAETSAWNQTKQPERCFLTDIVDIIEKNR